MNSTPINNGLLQSDLDCAGFDLLNFSGGGGGGGGGVARKFDVKTYGAIGDGTTDDTGAIQAALAAIPAGGGALYFPAGQYRYAGTTLTLNRQITVEGDGGGVQLYATSGGTYTNISGAPSISTVDFDSATGTLFAVAADGCAFRNIGLRNTRGLVATAGAGILVSSHGDRTTYDSISVDGFYINIDVQAGSCQVFNNCWIAGAGIYGLKLANILIPDGGDHSISNCYIYTAHAFPGVSAIRIESGGGIKIMNTKINAHTWPGWANGIDLALGSGLVTVDLLVTNCSIENFTQAGIKGRMGPGGYWGNIVLHGNQFFTGTYGIDFQGVAPDAFNGMTITGNFGWSDITGSLINLVNCSNVAVSNNVGRGYTNGVLTAGSGVTFANSPVYVGRDFRFVSVTGGAKIQARNPGTDTWADMDQWTTP